VAGAATRIAASPTEIPTAVTEALQIDWHATPMRAERFLERYLPAVSRVLAYGASGYVLLRLEEDSHHFVHISYWEDRADFDRYWFSHEMRAVRESLAGLHEQPVLPHWNAVLERR
jgi:quinol monooxygenase YgiN